MLQCELKDGVERCFSEDMEGRELCPENVNSVLLTTGAGQGLCLLVCLRWIHIARRHIACSYPQGDIACIA
jgi:hypothetical protein